MQARTFGTWASFFTSVGAGALTQSPDYQFLVLPVALVSGALFLMLSGMFLYSNRREILRVAKLIEPSHIIILGLLVALGGVVWQMQSSPHAIAQAAHVTAPFKDSGGATGTGNPLWDQIKEYLRKNGKTKEAELQPDNPAPNKFTMGDASDGRGIFITSWGAKLGMWPTVEDGFTPSQVRIFPRIAPKFQLPSDKKNFLAAVDGLSVVVNDKLGSVVAATHAALNESNSPLVTKENGHGAIDALKKLQKIETIRSEIEASLFRNNQGQFFDQYPKYKSELLGIIPDGSDAVWRSYLVALDQLTNSLMVVRQAETHPEDGQLFEYAVKDLRPYRISFLTAGNALSDWIKSVNDRIDLMTKVM